MGKLVHAAFAEKSKLPARVKREVKGVRSSLVEECAGSADRLTAIQIILIDRIVFKYAGCRAIEEYVKKVGLFKDNGEMLSLLDKNYLAWSNSMRLDLKELGSQRKPEDLLTPADWIDADEGDGEK